MTLNEETKPYITWFDNRIGEKLKHQVFLTKSMLS